MAKKPTQNIPPKASASPSKTTLSPPTSNVPVSKPTSPANTSLTAKSSPQEIALHVWDKYLADTPTRTVLLDVFMLFLVLVGAVQFLYCLLVGNYPFNAFLSGFSACAGQFVLTASLRMQTVEQPPSTASTAVKKAAEAAVNEVEQPGKPTPISSERAFADYVLGSLILHAFCVNFIN